MNRLIVILVGLILVISYRVHKLKEVERRVKNPPVASHAKPAKAVSIPSKEPQVSKSESLNRTVHQDFDSLKDLYSGPSKETQPDDLPAMPGETIPSEKLTTFEREQYEKALKTIKENLSKPNATHAKPSQPTLDYDKLSEEERQKVDQYLMEHKKNIEGQNEHQ